MRQNYVVRWVLISESKLCCFGLDWGFTRGWVLTQLVYHHPKMISALKLTLVFSFDPVSLIFICMQKNHIELQHHPSLFRGSKKLRGYNICPKQVREFHHSNKFPYDFLENFWKFKKIIPNWPPFFSYGLIAKKMSSKFNIIIFLS